MCEYRPSPEAMRGTDSVRGTRTEGERGPRGWNIPTDTRKADGTGLSCMHEDKQGPCILEGPLTNHVAPDPGCPANRAVVYINRSVRGAVLQPLEQTDRGAHAGQGLNTLGVAVTLCLVG